MSRWTKWLAVLGLVQALSLVPEGAAHARPQGLPHASFATTTGTTSVPYGWVDFCHRYDGQCEAAASEQDLVLTDAAWKAVDQVNRTVNRSVTPTTDLAHWGVIDQWDYPTDGKGDCEDYALWKRKLLIDQGVPASALLMTVVRDHADEGHAVLTMRTDHGEFVLDNMVETVLAWDQTGYRFVKRQSQADPNVWQSIGPATAAPMYLSTAR